jgi:hypothetical protein
MWKDFAEAIQFARNYHRPHQAFILQDEEFQLAHWKLTGIRKGNQMSTYCTLNDVANEKALMKGQGYRILSLEKIA